MPLWCIRQKLFNDCAVFHSVRRFYLGTDALRHCGKLYKVANGISAPVYVGLSNYAAVIHSPRFAKAFFNLLLYVAVTVPTGIGLAFCVALVVNRFKGFVAQFLRSAYFLPTLIPLFLTAVIWRWLLTPDFGLLNMGLSFLRLPQPNWLGDPRYMIPALVMADAWRATGFNMIILLAGMKNIPKEYYEAATIDGANAFAKDEVHHDTSFRASFFVGYCECCYFSAADF